jgi:cell division protein FtsB
MSMANFHLTDFLLSLVILLVILFLIGFLIFIVIKKGIAAGINSSKKIEELDKRISQLEEERNISD